MILRLGPVFSIFSPSTACRPTATEARNNSPTSAAALSRWPLDEAERCVAVQCCDLLLVSSTTP